MLLSSLFFVETSQGTVHTLVEVVVLVLGDPQEVHLFQDNVTGPDCPLQHRGEGYVKIETSLAKRHTSLLGLTNTLLSEWHINPAAMRSADLVLKRPTR